MSKFNTTLILSIAMVFAICLSTPRMRATTVDDIPPEVIIPQHAGDTNIRAKAPAFFPLTVVHYPEEDMLVATFNRNLGQVEVEMCNCTTGQTTTSTMSGSIGSYIIQVPPAAGFYSITFTLGSGVVYSGEFEI